MGHGKWTNRNGDEGYWKVAVGAAGTQTKIPVNTYSEYLGLRGNRGMEKIT